MSFDLADFSYSRQRAQTRVAAASHFTVRVNSQIVGLPVDCVETVFYLGKLTPVPLAPPEVAGLANLRGRIVTALHLDKCLRIDAAGPNAALLAVGITHNGDNYALIVDDTGDVIVSEEQDRIDCPAHLDARLAELMAAFYRHDGGFLSIIDIAALIKRVSRQSEWTYHSSAPGILKRGDQQ
ncbi:MAG: chemotaxis protein CheW [Methylocystis sp.]